MTKLSTIIEWLKVYGIAAIFIVVGFYVAFQYVGPAPTKNIAIATGGKSGAYYGFGQKYAQWFKKDGVVLNILETDGSIDNLKRLTMQKNQAQVALVQGGIGVPEKFSELESLGSLYYEPLWLFYTKGTKLQALGDLKGRRIALGRRESGTYALAAQLLAQNNVTSQTARFLDIGGRDGINALVAGDADVLFVVAGTKSDIVRELLSRQDVEIFSFQRAEAYVRNYKFLSRVVLPQGCLDFDKNIPNKDIILVAPGANMVVRNDLHPALIYLFLMAAQKVHFKGGLLEERSAFPNPYGAGFPLNKVAQRFYQSGPPFLMRVLPFWLATWLVRMFVMLIPLITVFYPLMKIAPPTNRWRIRRKVFKLYKILYQLELEASHAHKSDDVSNLFERLNALEEKATSLRVPASHMASQYHLRRNIDWIRNRLTTVQALSSNRK